jgi:hypothetical protein
MPALHLLRVTPAQTHMLISPTRHHCVKDQQVAGRQGETDRGGKHSGQCSQGGWMGGWPGACVWTIQIPTFPFSSSPPPPHLPRQTSLPALSLSQAILASVPSSTYVPGGRPHHVVLICSYTTFRMHMEAVYSKKFEMVICDEVDASVCVGLLGRDEDAGHHIVPFTRHCNYNPRCTPCTLTHSSTLTFTLTHTHMVAEGPPAEERG